MRDRLYRSRSDRMLFGVAGGMADWLDVDPSVVRLVWALLFFAAGIGLPLYIIAAIVVPEEPFGMSDPAAPAGPEAVGVAPGATTASPGASGTSVAGASQTRWEARQAHRAARRAHRGNGGIVAGLVLVFLGGWFLLQRFIPAFDASYVLPGVLILLGVALVVGALGRRGDGPG